MTELDVRGIGRQLEGHDRRIRAVESVTAELAERLEQAGTAASQPPTLVSWLLITDPDVARIEMSKLADWLGQVFVHYPGAMECLGDCWPWHAWAVEELRSLRWAWLDGYESGNAQRVADWHARLLPETVRRLAPIRQCGIDEHSHGGDVDLLGPRTVPAVDAALRLAGVHGSDALMPPPPTPNELAEAAGRRKP